MKKLIKVCLNPLTLLGLGWVIFSFSVTWRRKAFFDLNFLNSFGPFAGGASIIVTVAIIGGVIIGIITLLVKYGEWYDKNI